MTARILTGNSMFSSFTGNLRNSSYSKSGSFSRGQAIAFLAASALGEWSSRRMVRSLWTMSALLGI
ncbi:hypothetical protein [Microcoleus sp. Pol10D4]|uniref:hypothetical protein n=1 Tax=Microcoleus sp. Pol10D4 TaxID=3055387 RepID=UPI002FD25862